LALKHRIDEDDALARENAFTSAMPFGEEFAEAAKDQETVREDLPVGFDGEGDAVAVLEGWLATIGRMRECRSGRR